jgi:hypothetical protein
MEGSIAVNSEVGRGSSFAFTAKLPRADGATIAARATELTVHLPLTPLFVARRPVSKPTAAPRVTPTTASVKGSAGGPQEPSYWQTSVASQAAGSQPAGR